MRWVLLLSLMFWGSLAWAQDTTDVATPEDTEAVTESGDTSEPTETDEADEASTGETVEEGPDQPESTNLTELLRPSLGTEFLESLLDDSRFIDGLIPPLNPAAERARVASSTGRSDPFQPLNIRPVQPPEPPTVPDLPIVPTLPDISGKNPPPISMPPMPPEPTPDPAEFAKTVQVAGVIQIGGDTFAVLSSESALSEVVSVGGRYESAFVSGISLPDGQVLLEEGGQTISVVIPE